MFLYLIYTCFSAIYDQSFVSIIVVAVFTTCDLFTPFIMVASLEIGRMAKWGYKGQK